MSVKASSIAAFAMLALATVPTSAQTPKGDPVRGQTLFAQCKICHSLDAGKNGLGPSLKGIVGKKAAGSAGFNYSAAMKASALTWKAAVLSEYLTAPMKKVPGTKMAFAGMSKPQDRADIIAYLSKN